MPFTGEYHYANGKRKTSVARVRLYKGQGNIEINERPINEWTAKKTQYEKILSPLVAVGMKNKFDISIKVEGGGQTGQAEAIRHGISKALTVYDPNLRNTLKPLGFLTRDSRMKERKKYGLKGARKSPQFSKR